MEVCTRKLEEAFVQQPSREAIDDQTQVWPEDAAEHKWDKTTHAGSCLLPMHLNLVAVPLHGVLYCGLGHPRVKAEGR